MKAVFLMKDGRVKKKNKNVHFKDVDSVLMLIKSDLFGKAYVKVCPDSYRSYKKINRIDLNLGYCRATPNPDGYGLDESDMTIDYTYNLKNINQLFSKILEVCLFEEMLNETFWVHDCFQGHYFNRFSISYKSKKKKFEFNSVEKFYEKNNDRVESEPFIININGKKYKYQDSPEDLGDGEVFAYYGDGYYFRVRKDYWKKVNSFRVIRKTYEIMPTIDGKVDLDYSNGAGIFDTIYSPSKPSSRRWDDTAKFNGNIREEIYSYFLPYLHQRLPSECDYGILYHSVSILKEINEEKTKKRFDKFIGKYFVDLPIKENNFFSEKGAIPELDEQDFNINLKSGYLSSDLDQDEDGVIIIPSRKWVSEE